MRVRIIKSEAWHTGLVGREFNALRNDNGMVHIHEPGNAYHQNGLYDDDFELVTKANAETKFVTQDGIKYQVPSWANYLTRDRMGLDVWYWEKEPVWGGSNTGWAHDYSGDIGANGVAKPYVEPKPEGNFIVSI